MENYDYIKRNYNELREEVAHIAANAGVTMPKIVAVTKSATDDELAALASFGALDIGENRPGELRRRYELLTNAGFVPNMHQIGTLQRNKIKYIIGCVSMIHSVDSQKLAQDISRLASQCGRVVPVLIEVNSACEEQKSGVMPDMCEALVKEVIKLPNIKLKGLMTMGPALDDEELLRPYFKKTKYLFDTLGEKYGLGEWDTLSMGMSGSYRVAIEEGSTLIRVGRKLFIK